MKPVMENIFSRLDQTFEQSLERLFHFLQIESVSTDAAYHPECLRAAEWIGSTLGEIGFNVTVYPTSGKPMVLAHWEPSSPWKQKILFYGHYDVQPADPLNLWESPPFEPRIKTVNGQKEIVARGASDDKGQLMTFIEAFRVWFETGPPLPLALTVLIEGEEENGSPSLGTFLEHHKDALRSDMIFVCDTPMWNPETPAIVTGLRGLVVEEVVITAANRDLHSGLYGGVAWNPIHILARIIGDIHAADGKIQIPGFYDTLSSWEQEIPEFDEAAFLAGIGLQTSGGEQEYGFLERLWGRPSCDVNGIYGGYTGSGAKTVIPSQASAKISCRLVPGQDPGKISSALRSFVRQRLPDGISAQFTSHAASSAVTLNTQTPLIQTVSQALKEEFGALPVYMGCGATIPIVSAFQKTLGLDAFLLGFALEDDRIHSPNEKYNQQSFYRGIRSWIRILQALSENRP